MIHGQGDSRPLGRSVAGPPEALSDDEAVVFGNWMVMGRTVDELNPATVDFVDIQQTLLYTYTVSTIPS